MKPDLQRRVQRYGWDKAAEYYEDSWKRQLKPAQDGLMKFSELRPGHKVIETACGTGLVTFQAAKAVEPGGTVMATDISEVMVKKSAEKAREQKIENVTFRRMDAEQLEAKDNTFDAALCGLGLMYYPDPVQGLREMYRVLKPGGIATVVIWGERKNCGWHEIFPIIDKRVESDVCPMFFQQGTGNMLETSFREAGFSAIKTERFPVTLSYPDAETTVMAAFDGGPVALATKRFDQQTREEARQEYLDSLKSYKKGDGYEIPGEFVVACGVAGN